VLLFQIAMPLLPPALGPKQSFRVEDGVTGFP
jgi:hypothetical protein